LWVKVALTLNADYLIPLNIECLIILLLNIKDSITSRGDKYLERLENQTV